MLATGMDSTKCQFDGIDPDREARFSEMSSIKLDMTKEILLA